MDTQEIMEGKFTIWTISTSALRFKARLRAADIGLIDYEIDDNVSLGTKEMINQKDRVYLSQATGQIQNFMRFVSRRFFGRGLYLVPEAKILVTLEGLKKIKQAQMERVEEFLTRYDETMKEQIEKHPNLKTEPWPTPEDIRSFFSVTWKVFQLSGLEPKNTDPEELASAKAEFQAELKKGYEELKQEILGQAYQEMLSAIDAITEKINKQEKVSETNLKKPKAVIEQYLNIAAVFDLPQVIEKVKQVKQTLDSSSAKDLRDRPLFSREFATTVKSLSKDLQTLTGYSKDGRLKRTLDLEPEPPKPGNGPQARENIAQV
jgi:hypothetical protein